MTNILKPTFNNAGQYIITLPAVATFDLVFSQDIMDSFKQAAISPFPYSGTEDLSRDMIYASFVDKVAGRLKSFLQNNQEKSDISLLLDDDLCAQAKLRFSSSTQTVHKLVDNLEDMFGDLTLSPEAVSHGSSWKKLPIDKVNPASGLILPMPSR